MSSITASSSTATRQDESDIAATSSAVAAAEEALGSCASDEGSPASEATEESLPSAESDSTEDPYQKIIATLREQIKSTNEELVRGVVAHTAASQLILILTEKEWQSHESECQTSRHTPPTEGRLDETIIFV